METSNQNEFTRTISFCISCYDLQDGLPKAGETKLFLTTDHKWSKDIRHSVPFGSYELAQSEIGNLETNGVRLCQVEKFFVIIAGRSETANAGTTNQETEPGPDKSQEAEADKKTDQQQSHDRKVFSQNEKIFTDHIRKIAASAYLEAAMREYDPADTSMIQVKADFHGWWNERGNALVYAADLQDPAVVE